MSRTERKLRQAQAEIEALRADRPKMQESIALLTTQNFEMHSALQEAEIVLTAVQAVEAERTEPREWLTRLEFALMLARTALGIQPAKQVLWCSIPCKSRSPVAGHRCELPADHMLNGKKMEHHQSSVGVGSIWK